MWLVFMLPMIVICFSVFNVGMAVGEKMKIQNAADNAAYSAAVWEARYMNLVAYTNRAMVANYDTIATLTAIWSFIDASDGFVAAARTILRVFFDVGDLLTPVAKILHELNQAIAQGVGGGKKNPRAGRAIEEYSGVLSQAQRFLYVLSQGSRSQVISTIARGVDPDIEYFVGAEAFNAKSLDQRRKWDKTDENTGLRQTLEHSLNALSNGGSFRDANNFLPKPLKKLVDFVESVPCFDISIGPLGFDGPGFDHETGAEGSRGKTTIARNDKIYQNDFSGVKVEFNCFISYTLVDFGHNSDDARNMPNGSAFPHIFDEEGDHSDIIGKNLDCSTVGGVGGGGGGGSSGVDPEIAKLSDLNRQCQEQHGGNATDYDFLDPDGPGPKKCNISYGTIPPTSSNCQNCGQIQKELKERSEKLTSGANNFTASRASSICTATT